MIHKNAYQEKCDLKANRFVVCRCSSHLGMMFLLYDFPAKRSYTVLIFLKILPNPYKSGKQAHTSLSGSVNRDLADNFLWEDA